MGIFAEGRSGGGTAGHLSARFGANGRAGEAGEKYYADALRRAGIDEKYEVYHGVAIPQIARDKQPPRGDVDFAIASGHNLVLVDVKAWAPAIYWSIPRLGPMKNLTPLRKSNGEWSLSNNMNMALERFKAKLPGVAVSAIVVFVPSGGRGPIPQVDLLMFPGMIRSLRASVSYSRIETVLGEPREVDPAISVLLHRLKLHMSLSTGSKH